MQVRPSTTRLISACRKSERAYTHTKLTPIGKERVARLVADTITDAEVLVGPDTDVSAPTENAAFVAFRGTTTRADWNINSRLWLIPSSVGTEARVHSGFVMQWESVRSRVFDIVDELEPDSILLCGHSLGGALATIASTEFVLQYPDIPVEVITFGAPRCGNFAYIQRVAKIVFSMTRVVHDCDAVPSTPPLFMSYAHCLGEWLHLQSKPREEPAARAVWCNSSDGWWHEVQMLWRRLMNGEWGITDHDLALYLKALEDQERSGKDTV